MISIRGSSSRPHSISVSNCRIAREGDTYYWQEATAEFVNPTFDRLSLATRAVSRSEQAPDEEAQHG